MGGFCEGGYDSRPDHPHHPDAPGGMNERGVQAYPAPTNNPPAGAPLAEEDLDRAREVTQDSPRQVRMFETCGGNL